MLKMPVRKATTIVMLAFGLAAAACSTSNSDAGAPRTIRLTERNLQIESLDFGSQGESMGDQFFFNADLSDPSGDIVGDFGGSCALISVPPNPIEAQCSGSIALSDGRINFGGLEVGPFDLNVSRTVHLAVLGGTGAYRAAAGQITITGMGEPDVLVELER